jgi:glycine cleavage system protein P-like pyridoxal-binding family
VVLERLVDEGFLAGIALDPDYASGADNGLLVAVTERRTRVEIDAFVDAMSKAVH